jgi:uroporphyrinogen-III synthase
VQEAVVYRQEACPPSTPARAALDGSDPLVTPLFSPRSAELLAGWTPSAPLHVVALSPAVAEMAARLHPASLAIAAAPEGLAMVGPTLDALAGRVGRLEPSDGGD